MKTYDLIIVGTGSGNSIPDERFDEMSIAIVEEGRFGGTCLNVGCIPTKMFVYPAEVAAEAVDARRLGVELDLKSVDWRDIQRRVFDEKVDPIAAGGEEYRCGERTPNIDVYAGHAVFSGPRTLHVGDEEIAGRQIVLAVGSRPVIPEQIASSRVRYRTNEDVMRLPERPERLVIVGGGYIAMEFAHVFASLGTEVTVLVRSGAALRHLDEELVRRFNDAVRERFDIRYHTEVVSLADAADGAVEVEVTGGEKITTDEVLVATGRVPNGDLIEAAAGGVEVDGGRVVVDEYGRSVSAEGVWALGDVSSPFMLKHVANAEARAVQHNLLHLEDLRPMPHEAVPAAVFTHPQIASVGMTENEARESGREITVKVQEYGDVAYGWAMDEHTGVVKLIANRETGRLLGAHILGTQAPTLIQTAVTAMAFDLDVRELARGQYWIHPALPEVVENALLGLEFDQ
ncbi:mycothione reductase [Corynebacterium frankenforstense]